MILKINTNCSIDTYIKRIFNFLEIELDDSKIVDIVDSIDYYYDNCQYNHELASQREEINFLRHLILLREEKKNHD